MRDSAYITSSSTIRTITVAQLEVIEFYKRPALEKTSASHDANLKVLYYPGWACPKPPSYPLHRKILAFLSEPDSSGYYRTVALSYGTKSVAPSEVPGYRNAILEYVELLQLDDSEARVQLNEWFLCHLQTPGVGDLMALELSRGPVQRFGPDIPPPRSQWRPEFTKKQQQRLAQSMMEDLDWKFRGDSQFLLYPLCVEHADGAFLQYMVNSLVAHGTVPWKLHDFLIVLSDRMGQKGCRLIAEDIAEVTTPDCSSEGQPSRQQVLAMEVLECLR